MISGLRAGEQIGRPVEQPAHAEQRRARPARRAARARVTSAAPSSTPGIEVGVRRHPRLRDRAASARPRPSRARSTRRTSGTIGRRGSRPRSASATAACPAYTQRRTINGGGSAAVGARAPPRPSRPRRGADAPIAAGRRSPRARERHDELQRMQPQRTGREEVDRRSSSDTRRLERSGCCCAHSRRASRSRRAARRTGRRASTPARRAPSPRAGSAARIVNEERPRRCRSRRLGAAERHPRAPGADSD